MKKKLLPAFLIAALFIAGFSACTKKPEKFLGDYSKNYFPLKIGKSITYDVDSVLWDDYYDVRSLHHYQIRWTIVDTFRDAQFRLSYRLQTYIRKQDTLAWQNHTVIYLTPTDNSIEYVEDNLRFIKLIFPIQNGGTWKGNALISPLDKAYTYFQGWNYYYDNFAQPFSNGFMQLDNTVTVHGVDDTVGNPETRPTEYASKTYAEEVYGQGIGMVYREMIHWVYDPSKPGTPFRDGYSVVMKAVEYN
jgi:hypothetical protein